MKINHLNLTVPDVPTTRDFLETYFGLECIGSKGNGFAALNDDDGFLLNLISGKEVYYPETFHVGFPQENKRKVDELHQRLKADRYEVWDPAHAHGSYTFYFQAPGKFTVEVYCQITGEDVSVVHPYFSRR